MKNNRNWKKILYEDQGVPDNYVDELFLVDLRKNLYTRTYSFWPTVVEAGVVTQQICSVFLFVVIFIYMDEGKVHPYFLFGASSTVTLLGYILNNLLVKEPLYTSLRTKWDDLKSCLLFLACGFGLSPLLMTLTDTISTDTIYAMTVFMLIANLLFHDYMDRYGGVYQPLSLNAAIFASVCLASRLPGTWHAFATVTFAVEIFALWPVLRRKIKDKSLYGQVAMTLTLDISTILAVLSISIVGAILILIGLLFVTFICPLLLIRLQPYKNNIYGPWDEAVIKD